MAAAEAVPPAILPFMETLLSSHAKSIVLNMYSELQASASLPDRDRDDAQMHLLERMLFEAGEDRSGLVAVGFASHPVLRMGFVKALCDAADSELASIVNWRVLARLLRLAHRVPTDVPTWTAIGESWSRSQHPEMTFPQVYGSFAKAYFNRMAGQKLPNAGTSFENIIAIWHGMLGQCFNVERQRTNSVPVIASRFRECVNIVVSVLVLRGAFSLSKVVLKALSTFIPPTFERPLWASMSGKMDITLIVKSYLCCKLVYAPHNTDKAGKQFSKLMKLIGGSWDSAAQVTAMEEKGDGNVNTRSAFSPSRALALVLSVRREWGDERLKKFLQQSASLVKPLDASTAPSPLYFVLLFRSLQMVHRVTRRWMRNGIRELLAAGKKQNRAHPVSPKSIMPELVKDISSLVDVLASHVPKFSQGLNQPFALPKDWPSRTGYVELRSWQHGFVSNIMAAFSVCHCVLQSFLWASGEDFYENALFQHDSSDQDEFGLPRMTRSNTILPQEASWILDLIHDNGIKNHGVRAAENVVEFTNEPPFRAVQGPLQCDDPSHDHSEENMTNYAIKPLVPFGVKLLQHLFIHHSVEMPLPLRTASNAGPRKPTKALDCSDESAVGVNSKEAWRGSLSWIVRRQVLLRRQELRTGGAPSAVGSQG